MYSKVKSKVRTNAGYSDTFNLTTGLMQGECLSPSLFSSFINDLDEAMDDVESMGVTIYGTRITVLKYADDIVLLADNEEGLQDGLQALHAYCVKNRLTVNTAKSKVMYFSKKVIKSPRIQGFKSIYLQQPIHFATVLINKTYSTITRQIEITNNH